jgi:hypothetical protein
LNHVSFALFFILDTAKINESGLGEEGGDDDIPFEFNDEEEVDLDAL